MRHATRFALPAGTSGAAWLLAGADPQVEDRALGRKRARAATLLALALPGSMYLYQGEELGLPEVGDIPDEQKQDPSFFRDRGTSPGRDGCRVPLPWTSAGPSFGFGAGAPHLPQPEWFADYAVAEQDADPESTLTFYRRALELRRTLRSNEEFEWIDHGDEVVAFRRADGWVALTNFGTSPVSLPAGTVLIASDALDQPTLLPADTTVWMRVHDR